MAPPILSLSLIGLLLIGWIANRYEPTTAPEDADVVVYFSPSCKCHVPWVRYLRRDGLAVSVQKTRDIVRTQTRLGIPREFSGCHTAVASGYWIEGHVPPSSIKELLSVTPDNIAGLAHLRANIATAENVSWEVVSYDTKGQSIVSTRQDESTDEGEDVSHNGRYAIPSKEDQK